MDYFDANDALIDQTLVGRSADAFDASRSPQQRLDGLLHLSILLDAVALHERLFTIQTESTAVERS